MRFVTKLARIRRQFPILRRDRFLTGAYNEELQISELTWLTPARHRDEPEDWEDPIAKCMGLILDGRAQPTGIRQRGSDRTVLLIVNASHVLVKFKLPEVTGGGDWRLMIDTNQPDLEDEPISRSARNTKSPLARCCCSSWDSKAA